MLESLALSRQGEIDAIKILSDALRLAEPGGYIRLFADEGTPMSQLLAHLAGRGVMPDYVAKLQAAIEADKQARQTPSLAPSAPRPQALIEPLSQRGLQVLQLVAEGLSNREISERLVLTLITVKGHNQKIFDKLQVHRRTEAVAHAANWVCYSPSGSFPLSFRNNTPLNTSKPYFSIYTPLSIADRLLAHSRVPQQRVPQASGTARRAPPPQVPPCTSSPRC